MKSINLITRRGFLDAGARAGLGMALASLVNVPHVMKQALAAEALNKFGLKGKKVFFIFLRGANDALNSVIPLGDDAYEKSRPTLKIPAGGALTGTLGCLFPESGPVAPTFNYNQALTLRGGFAGLHPALKFLAPVYNAGDLAFVHRVAYPKQSRSHFDSQNYWETGNPNDNLKKDGVFYRTILESGLTEFAAISGVSIQSALPLCLRGSAAAMTNLADPTRYDLLGVPNTVEGNQKADAFLRVSNNPLFANKHYRDLLHLQYKNLTDTLNILNPALFDEKANTFQDDELTDGHANYFLFPTIKDKNGGFFANIDNKKFVIDSEGEKFFIRLKAAALILNKTDAMVAGTQLDGFDTHGEQGRFEGAHPVLLRRIAWAIYGLRKYFMQFGDRAKWKDTVIVTLSEFGRTTVENSSQGTDHAEAGAMFLAGGNIKGYDSLTQRSGVFGCSPNDEIPWVTGSDGSMFGADGRYLKRAYDYRQVLGRVIRDHLGASQEQLDRIIPGYANAGERLLAGGVSTKDGVKIMKEPDFIREKTT